MEDFWTHEWDAFLWLLPAGEVSVLLAEGLLLLGIPLDLHLIPLASPGCCTLARVQNSVFSAEKGAALRKVLLYWASVLTADQGLILLPLGSI